METSIKLIVISFVLIITSCNNNQIKNEQAVSKDNQIVQKENILNISALYQNVDSLTGKTISVKGIIDHVCPRSGKRFKIINLNGQEYFKIVIREDLSDISETSIGNTVTVKGILKFQKLYSKDVEEWIGKIKVNHAGEEDTEHYKEEIGFVLKIKEQIENGEIEYYAQYFVEASYYEFQ